MEACLASFEGKIVTQKDLAALATGTVSPATISRVVQDMEDEGWIATRPSDTDARVPIVEVTPRASEYYLSKVYASWAAFWSIADSGCEPKLCDRAAISNDLLARLQLAASGVLAASVAQ
jgi:hypothetical protein